MQSGLGEPTPNPLLTNKQRHLLVANNNNTPKRMCSNCHIEYDATTENFRKQKAGKYGLSSWCKKCLADYQRSYLAIPKNKKHHADYQREYVSSHPDYVARERELDRKRKADKRASGVAYILWNEWANTPQGKLYKRAKAVRRKRNMKLAGGHVSAADIRLQVKSQKNKCWWCGKTIGDEYHIDHVLPISRGGSNNPNNIVISCPKCNLSKGDKLPTEWIGRLL